MLSRCLFVILAILTATGFAVAEIRQTAQGAVDVSLIVDDLDTPWSLAFLPDGGFLVTERDGRLLHFSADGKRHNVRGVKKVRAKGQGGLLDIMVPRDFAQTREIFISYAMPQRQGVGTAVAVAKLSRDGTGLRDYRVIFEMERGSSGGRHFGSRIVEGRDGYIYVTIGDRGDGESAQDLSRQNGSIIRIARDGSIPSDNPFVGRDGAKPEIWSYGHRNPQGAALDESGQLWAVEHGAAGGDEVNAIRPGANYGWPVISYGTHYSGAKIGEGTAKDGMEQPQHYWDPSIAPSGMVIYSGVLFPQWRGDFLVGSLKFGLISRLERGVDILREVERIEWPETDRTRDLRQAPDGSIWIVSEGNGAIYRVAPAE